VRRGWRKDRAGWPQEKEVKTEQKEKRGRRERGATDGGRGQPGR